MKLTLGWKWWIKVRFTTLFCIFHYAIILLIYNCLRDSHLVFNKLKCFRRIMILRVSMKVINSSLSFRLDVYIPYLPVKLDFGTAYDFGIVIPSHYYDDENIKMFIFEIPLPCYPILISEVRKKRKMEGWHLLSQPRTFEISSTLFHIERFECLSVHIGTISPRKDSPFWCSASAEVVSY